MRGWKELTRAERIERWKNARRVVQSIADNPHYRSLHWDMSTWATRTECGTIACVVGHCSFDSWFIAQGLRGSWDKDGRFMISGVLGIGIPRRAADFFGWEGTNKILMNVRMRPPEAVLIEIDDYLADLRGDQ